MNAKITDKPRTLKELAAFYQVNTKTFKKWLNCETLRNIRPENGYYYSISQLKLIVSHIGEP